jgi:CpeS-like protein
MDAITKFHYFFDCCIGAWSTERTYHYLTRQEVERSRTEFIIRTLTPPLKEKVLRDNGRSSQFANSLLGFYLAFQTVSEKGEEVSQDLNMLFVPDQEDAPVLEGAYLRDRAYEEDRPMVAHFRFDPHIQELVMTTTYTEVVAVDSITLINPNTRIRKILTYRRPNAGQSLENLVLVGFGVEQKIL